MGHDMPFVAQTRDPPRVVVGYVTVAGLDDGLVDLEVEGVGDCWRRSRLVPA